MIFLFSFTPTVAVWMATLLQIIYMIIYVLNPTQPSHDDKGKWYISHILYVTYFVFGVILLHSGISWLSGQWTYIDWRFQVPSVILIMITGIYYVMGCILKKPRFYDIVYFSIIAVLILVVFIIFLSVARSPYAYINIFAILVIGLLVLLYPAGRYLVRRSKNRVLNYRLIKKKIRLQNRYWTLINWILWGLLTAETLLKLSGLSLFIWF